MLMDGIGQNYISLREAARYSGRYSQEYLSLRARQGKLKAIKIGRNWVTKKEWLDEYLREVNFGNKNTSSKKKERKKLKVLDDGFITLKEAARYSGYSQDYLGLRIRQGKIKAIKIARNWVTKKEWIDDYVKQVNDYKNKYKYNPHQVSDKKEVISTISSSTFTFQPVPRAKLFAIVVALVFVFSSIGLVFGYPYYGPALKKVVTNVGETVSEIAETVVFVGDSISESISDFSFKVSQSVESLSQSVSSLTEYGRALKQGTERVIYQTGFGFKGFTAEVSQGVNGVLINPIKNLFTDIGDKFTQYVTYDIQSLRKFGKRFLRTIQGIGESINQLTKNFVRIVSYNLSRPFRASYQFITHLWQKPEEGTGQEKLLPKPEKEGLVVIPSAGRRKQELDEIKESIKASFSDEVRVIPEDENSGIIVPIFREREGQEYIYLMVPVR